MFRFVLQLWNVFVSSWKRASTNRRPRNLSFSAARNCSRRGVDSLLTGIIAWLAGGWPRSEGEPWGRSRGSMALSIRVSSLRRRLRQLPLQRVSVLSRIFSRQRSRSHEFPTEGSATADKSNAPFQIPNGRASLPTINWRDKRLWTIRKEIPRI